MEKYMVIIVIEGKLNAHFFQHREIAESFLHDWLQIRSGKLYEYNPETDSWENI